MAHAMYPPLYPSAGLTDALFVESIDGHHRGCCVPHRRFIIRDEPLQKFVRAELRLVGHRSAGFDPVAEVHVAAVGAAAEIDLLERRERSRSGWPPCGVVKEIDARQRI